jgi:hypothetical protein
MKIAPSVTGGKRQIINDPPLIVPVIDLQREAAQVYAEGALRTD